LFRVSSFIFSVINENGCRSICQVSVKGKVKFEHLLRENEFGYERITNMYRMNQMYLDDGENGGIEHVIARDYSNGLTKGLIIFTIFQLNLECKKDK
jgi:hypothetical protein